LSGGVYDLKQEGNTAPRGRTTRSCRHGDQPCGISRPVRHRAATGVRPAPSSRDRTPASRSQASRDPRFPPFRRPSGGPASREHYLRHSSSGRPVAARPFAWRGSLRSFAIARSSEALSVTQGRQDSNLQPPVLETGALPIELRPSVRDGIVSAPIASLCARHAARRPVRPDRARPRRAGGCGGAPPDRDRGRRGGSRRLDLEPRGPVAAAPLRDSRVGVVFLSR
jgi:hypothetical protein